MRAISGLLSFQPYSLAACEHIVSTFLHFHLEIDLTYSLHEHEALCVGDDLGSVKSLLEILEELLLVTLELWCWARESLAGTGALALERRQTSGEHSLTNESHWLAHVQCVDGSPLAGTLLTCSIKNLLNQWFTIVVVEVKDIAGDLDEERVEHALVPLGEHIGNLLALEAETALEDVVGL